MEITIIIKVDKSCDMACVYDSLGNGMEGNYCDFHNGCHGLYDIDEFDSYLSLAKVLELKHIKEGNSVKIIKEDYKYS